MNQYDYMMIQFFVGIETGFAYDISSPILSNNNNVGATFQSILFKHCTSVPIWIDNHGNYHLKGPKKCIILHGDQVEVME